MGLQHFVKVEPKGQKKLENQNKLIPYKILLVQVLAHYQ